MQYSSGITLNLRFFGTQVNGVKFWPGEVALRSTTAIVHVLIFVLSFLSFSSFDTGTLSGSLLLYCRQYSEKDAQLHCNLAYSRIPAIALFYLCCDKLKWGKSAQLLLSLLGPFLRLSYVVSNKLIVATIQVPHSVRRDASPRVCVLCIPTVSET
jgi:hypothetical protein